VFYNVVLK